MAKKIKPLTVLQALELFDNGIMTGLFNRGFISAKIFIYKDIYLWVNAQIKTRKTSKMIIIDQAANKFKTSSATVRRALNAFKP